MNPTPPRVVLPGTTRRDALVAAITGLLVLAFVAYGIMEMGKPPPRNDVTGIVVGKEFTPQKERQIAFNGRKIVGTRETDGDYVLKVRVEKENRTFEVPVEKAIYESKKEGDSLTFLRPESEQR